MSKARANHGPLRREGAVSKDPRINSQRLWDSLMEMAKIGATEKGGVCRLALTDLDKQARDLFVKWCKEAGCTIKIDKMGNIFARRSGKDNSLAPVMTGSHIDSQPTGGKFDGVYGVLAGLEVIRTLNDFQLRDRAPRSRSRSGPTRKARASPRRWSPRACSPACSIWSTASPAADLNGKTHRRRSWLASAMPATSRSAAGPIAAFFEAHIEQGPILEDEGKTIGVVQGAQGQRWFEVTADRAGGACRPDADEGAQGRLVGAAHVITRDQSDRARQPAICLRDGRHDAGAARIRAIPFRERCSSPSICAIPKTRSCPRWRPRPRLRAKKRLKRTGWNSTSRRSGTHRRSSSTRTVWRPWRRAPRSWASTICPSSAVPATMPAISNRVAPTAMVFVPCANGISHNEVENALQADVAAGCDVLLRAMLERANVV